MIKTQVPLDCGKLQLAGGKMRRKLILAAVAAPLFFGSMHTNALAFCSASPNFLSCSVGSTATLASEALQAIKQERTSYIQQVFNASISSWLATYNGVLNKSVTNVVASYSPYYVSIPNGGYIQSNSTYSLATISVSIEDGIATFVGSLSAGVNFQLVRNPYTYFIYANDQAPRQTQLGVDRVATQKVPVPGPEAGAGIGALALGGLALYMKRRRRGEALAA